MLDLLQGVRVLEVALLAPDALGMHLADMGADVIKVEEPPHGDYVRVVGGTDVGGSSLLHWRWNRGKRSLSLDLKQDEGRLLFLDLVRESHVVIDGLRAGAMDRFGAGYESLRRANPKLVYCSLNGTGQSGPYQTLPTHGVAFDAYAGLSPPSFRDDDTPYIGDSTPVGIVAGPLYAAMAVCAALVRAKMSGEGRRVEVAEMDAAAAWQPRGVELAVNGVEASAGSMEAAVRYQYYRTKDGTFIIFQASEDKFWRNFCQAIGREDLLERGERRRVGDHARGDEELRAELGRIFAGKSRAEWVEFFMRHNVPGGPVNEPRDLIDDPHFRERGLLFEQHDAKGTRLQWIGPPVKVEGQSFSATPAPSHGQHTDDVLKNVLGLDAARVAELRRRGVV